MASQTRNDVIYGTSGASVKCVFIAVTVYGSVRIAVNLVLWQLQQLKHFYFADIDNYSHYSSALETL